MAGFFLNKDEKEKYEKTHGKIEEKTKRKYTRRDPSTSSTSHSKSSSKSLSSLSSSTHKPEHFENKLKFVTYPTGKLLQSLIYFTKDGIRLGLIYEYHTTSKVLKYEAKLLDSDFRVINEKVLEDLNSCKKYLSLLPETIEIEDNDSGLLTIIKDVLKKIGQLDKEIYFMFRLLIDPEERKQYDIKEVENAWKKTEESLQYKGKKKENDSLVKLGADLRKKIKGLEGMKGIK